MARAIPRSGVVVGRRRTSARTGMWITSYLFLLPALAIYLVFLVYPIVNSLWVSLHEWDGLSPTWRFIGLENYRRLLEDDLFWKSLYNTLYYTVLAVPIGAVVAMIMALAMNQRVPEVTIYRAILYLPSVLPLFAVSFLFMTLLDPVNGIVSRLMTSVGLRSVNWFGDPRWAKLAIVIMAQYGAGQVALIFLAGLKGIPISLYEAAMLDGAGAWNRFRNITIPMMTPVILYDLILGLSLGLQVFTQAYVITQGGPADSTRFYVMYLYDNAFRYGKMGYASALAWVLFVITFVLAMLIFRWSQRWVHYETT